MVGPRSPNGRGRRLKPAPVWVRVPSGAQCRMLAPLAEYGARWPLLPHSLAGKSVSARSLVQDSGAGSPAQHAGARSDVELVAPCLMARSALRGLRCEAAAFVTRSRQRSASAHSFVQAAAQSAAHS
jgi:hypothetical protein